MKERILALAAQGWSYKQIKDELGCSKGTIAYHLGVGQKEKSATRRRNQRTIIRRYLQEIKSKTPCTDCKERYPYWMMEFDHLRDKKFLLSNFTKGGHSGTLEAIKDEVAKCEVVCSNCHRNRTFVRAFGGGRYVDFESCTDFESCI